MNKQITKVALLGLLTAALVAIPSVTRAQDASTNGAPAATAPHHHAGGIHGKVASVDTAAMTITVGETTIVITSETKITKDGKPATLSDIAVGDYVSAAGKKDDSGKFNATRVADGKMMKKKKADDSTTSTNAPPQ
ncbi:MAG TPA: DUF5666 domain-containing protein [Candidatus Sulfotelmatobacter sp.]|jgi:hypothetical protein|nr:DUF5666 domain-containing protein [Candidatus Sulfotelmatobacter sp.]